MSPTAQRSFPIWVALGLCVIVLVAHGPLRHSGYVQDDELAVESNRIVERADLAEIFGTSYWEGARGADRTLYRPVVIASYAVERRATGEPNPFVSQAVNVGLHLLVTLSMLLFALRLGAGPLASAAAAAFFAVHPIHVEAIANIVGRAELLAALFSLLALAALTHSGPWAGSPARHPRLAAWTAAASLFLALGAKEVAFAAPLLMVALELLLRPAPHGRDRAWWIDRAAALAPSVLAGVVYLTLRVRALGMLVSLQPAHRFDNLLVELAGTERIATALGLLARYARLLLFPGPLAADYSGDVIAIEHGLLSLRPLLGLIFLVLLIFPTARVLRRALADAPTSGRLRLFAFAALMFLLPYLIVGNLLFNVGTIFAERLLYLPSIGYCLLAGLFLDFLLRLPTGGAGAQTRQRRIVLVILGIVVAAFVFRSWSRSLDWRDNRTVFLSAARVNPLSPRAHFILGKLAIDDGKPDEAIEHLDRTLELKPDHPTAWLEKGNALAALKRYGEAEVMYRETLRLSPGYGTAHRNLAIALRRQNRIGEAETALRKSLLWDPDSATGWAELGNLYLQTRRYAEAADAYRQAISRGRDDLKQRLERAEQELKEHPAPGKP